MPVVDSALRSQLERAVRRYGPRNSKKGNRLYYKGRGAWKGGFNTKKGRFQADESKMKFLIVPDLTGFKLTPYVACDTPKVKVPAPTVHLGDNKPWF